MGDMTSHGGVIVGGFPTVLIGETGGGGGGASAVKPPPSQQKKYEKVIFSTSPSMKTKMSFIAAAKHSSAVVHNSCTCKVCK
jgi:uncharacterized Zn-binding protein involved in type VI secretion